MYPDISFHEHPFKRSSSDEEDEDDDSDDGNDEDDEDIQRFDFVNGLDQDTSSSWPLSYVGWRLWDVEKFSMIN